MKIASLLLVLASLFLAGCTGNPTNEPTAADIEAASKARAAAIDNDPSLTEQQKADMKAHMSLGAAGGQKR